MASKHFEASPDDQRAARHIARVICERFPEQVCNLQGIERGTWGETDIPPPLRPNERGVAEDILRVHTGGGKLKLQQMLENINTYDAVHDVMGIVQYLDRDTGKLREHFEPRFTDYQAQKEDARG